MTEGKAKLVGVLAAMLVATGGCVSQACTVVGCLSGVQVEVSESALVGAVRVEACLNDSCLGAELPTEAGACISSEPNGTTNFLSLCKRGPLVVADFQARSDDLRNGDSLHFVAFDSSGDPVVELAELLTYETSTPNGPDCEPSCKLASLRM